MAAPAGALAGTGAGDGAAVAGPVPARTGVAGVGVLPAQETSAANKTPNPLNGRTLISALHFCEIRLACKENAAERAEAPLSGARIVSVPSYGLGGAAAGATGEAVGVAGVSNQVQDVENVQFRELGEVQNSEVLPPNLDGLLTTFLQGFMTVAEVASRIVRDLDDEGRLLWIPDSKTEAGKRTLQVSDLLRPYLVALAEGKKVEELLFGYHDRNWPRKWVARICKAAGVPRVTAHGMRGLHGTLAVETGLSAHAVAAALGHESVTTTLQSYAKAGAGASARQEKVLTVLAGGIQAAESAA